MSSRGHIHLCSLSLRQEQGGSTCRKHNSPSGVVWSSPTRQLSQGHHQGSQHPSQPSVYVVLLSRSFMLDKHCTIVANRVREICNLVPPEQWRYVATYENPADHISQGLSPRQLIECTLWWKGPEWLQFSPDIWPRRPDINRSRKLPELKSTILLIRTPPCGNAIPPMTGSFGLLHGVFVFTTTVSSQDQRNWSASLPRSWSAHTIDFCIFVRRSRIPRSCLN